MCRPPSSYSQCLCGLPVRARCWRRCCHLLRDRVLMEASGKPAPCGKHIVLWSVAVPSKHLLSSNGEKQVVLSLDLDKQTICISAFPDVRQSVEDGVSNAAAKFVSDSAAVEATSARQRATSRTVDSSGLGTARSSISQADWNIVFGQPPREKKSKSSRWPWTIAFC